MNWEQLREIGRKAMPPEETPEEETERLYATIRALGREVAELRRSEARLLVVCTEARTRFRELAEFELAGALTYAIDAATGKVSP